MITKYFGSGPQNEKRSQNRDTIFPFTDICLRREEQHYALKVDKH